MIFDDSLSAVDAETDLKIRKALREKTSDATVILISHRTATLMHAENIMVLDKGKVTDIGTHSELISRDGLYRTIYEIQMQNKEEVSESDGK
jgi:ATP-binding cassette subfamily B protein